MPDLEPFQINQSEQKIGATTRHSMNPDTSRPTAVEYSGADKYTPIRYQPVAGETADLTCQCILQREQETSDAICIT